MNKNKTNISVVNAAGIRINSNIIVGEQGTYSSGDILDANAVESLVVKKIDDVIDGASTALDTLKELGDAIPTKVSDLNNDLGFITEEGGLLKVNQNVVTVISNQPFPSTWPTSNSYSFSDLISAIDADTDAVLGKVYLATIHYSDLRSAVDLVDAELKVEIMESSGSHKIARFTITSANKAPYYWQTTMWNGLLHGWKSFVVSGSLATVATSGSYTDLTDKPTIPTVPTNISAFNNDTGYTTNVGTITGITMNGSSKGTSGVIDLGTVLTQHQDISGKEDKISIEAPVDSTDPTDPITTLTCAINKYYRIAVPVETLAVTLPTITDTTKLHTVVLYLTGGADPNVTITSASSGVEVYYHTGFLIDTDKTYEVCCLWNGITWIVSEVEIEIPSPL